MKRAHQLGLGFAVHKDFVHYVKEFNPISERLSTIGLNKNPMNLFIINIHAPTECKKDMKKGIFYKETIKILDEIPKNTIKIIIGDCDSKIGKESMFIPTIRLQSLRESCNNNGSRANLLASSRNITISSTTSTYKDPQAHMEITE